MFKNTVGPSKLYNVLCVAVACSVGINKERLWFSVEVFV